MNGPANVILGINAASGHDSGAALLIDGALIAACEEERLTRIKRDGTFPKRSIDYCLNTGGIRPSEVTAVALGWHPWTVPLKRLGFLLDIRSIHHVARKALFLRALLVHPYHVASQLREMLPSAKIVFVKHHQAHAASAFFCSQFDEAAVITMDGRGEWSTGLLAHGKGSQIENISEAFFPQSLGMLYTAFTHYLGFETFDEYKVMGLSSYGDPEYLDILRKIIRFDANCMYNIDHSWFRHWSYASAGRRTGFYTSKFVSHFGEARKFGEPITTRHRNIAKSLQTRIEEVGVEIAQYARQRTGADYLVLAGGVCLNGLMNFAIRKQAGFRDVFIQPAADDGGTALGAALHVCHQIRRTSQRMVMEHAYWGPEFSDSDIQKELAICSLQFVKLKDAARSAAEFIADGNIIGWFQGRAELGPRALGNRSILADPRNAENKNRVNASIKYREEFRPFAPSVLREFAASYFEGIESDSPFMLMICPVATGKRQLIPAVTHVDGTARPQTVSKETNPKFYRLISQFQQITGIPVVLNTSFNVKDEPIVNSPADAIRCFVDTGLDYLIIGDYLVCKGKMPDNLSEATN